MINGSIGLLILAIPFVLRSSHVSFLKAIHSLRLPFLSQLLLSTRILNVSRREFNGILVSCWTWVPLSLHLPNHVWVNCCRGIFNVLSSVVSTLSFFHRHDYKIMIIVGKIILTASIVSPRGQRSIDHVCTSLTLGIEILTSLSSIYSWGAWVSLIMALWRNSDLEFLGFP